MPIILQQTVSGAALRFLENIEVTLKLLAEYPSIGALFLSDISELHGLRTCRVKGFPNHFVFYLEHANAVEIVRILHGARDIDKELSVG